MSPRSFSSQMIHTPANSMLAGAEARAEKAEWLQRQAAAELKLLKQRQQVSIE